ncbi:MAG: phosphatidylserine decarboxylase family protein [Bacteroidales bacterium]|nr:phosphatidylserine decarboxylase family protein [Bacteroidales bacterium]
MKIHKEGRLILLLSFLILSGINLLIYLLIWQWLFYIILISSVVLFGFILWFFRLPARPFTKDENLIYAPADGKVVVIEETFEDEYLKKKCIQISIFMSPLNVHVNRYPVSGTVKYYAYHKGKYLVAWHPKSSTENERATVVIENVKNVKILIRQIAGAVARRIVTYSKEGLLINQCDELGFIKFGSRVDIFLPLDVKILVNLNQKTKGGQTLLARFN